MSKFQRSIFEKSLFEKLLFYYKKCPKIPKSGKILEKYFKTNFLAFLESRHHNLRKCAKKNLQFIPTLTYTEDIVKSAFYSKTAVFGLFSKRASWNLLIFARDIVLTYPDYTPRLELMPNFDGIYLD